MNSLLVLEPRFHYQLLERKDFWRMVGEIDGSFDPGMYSQIQDQLSLTTDFTDHIRN